MTSIALRLRQARRRREAGQLALDIGHEPPIAPSDAARDEREHWRSLFRWIAGATIGGLSGGALLMAAIYLGLGGRSNLAESPEFAAAQTNADDSEAGVSPEKGDRLVRPLDVIAAKQTYRADTTLKVGATEVTRPRLYTLLSTNLSTATSAFAAQVPPFNPNRLTAGLSDAPEALPDLGPAPENPEIATASRDPAPADLVAVGGELNASEVEAQVDALLKATSRAGADSPLGALDLLKIASDARGITLDSLPYAEIGTVSHTGPYGGLSVRIVPENVTTVPRYALPSAPPDRLVSARNSEKLEDVLRANGAPPQRIAAILAAFKDKGAPLPPGQKVLLHFEDPDDGSKAPAIARVALVADEKEQAAAAIDDAGAFEMVKVASAPAAAKGDDSADSGGVSLYQSVYESALKQGLTKPIIDEIISAFASDVDYQRAASAGDTLQAFYSMPDDIDPNPQLLYAALSVKDQTYRYYRFRTPDDGLVDFYDDSGRSSRKLLLRKPITAGEMTSPFGMRYHPILHYSKLHSGVDWAAAIGTPILAAGNGQVIMAKFDPGYGRRVEIQHANGYVSTYSHMSGFARGIVEGVQVRQGQVIGYLGQSGLATGPHLHYEVVINGNFVDPLGIKLARTREFDGKMLAQFKKERERIDGLMAQAPTAAAQVTAKVN